MNIKKFGLITLLVVIIFVGLFIIFKVPSKTTNEVINSDIKENKKLNIVVTNFVSFDFVRAIGGDSVNLTFLIGPRERCT